MPEAVESWTELALAGAGWELRFTEGMLASEALSARSGPLSEAIVEVLEAIDRDRPIEEQLVQRDGDRLLVQGPGFALRIEPDGSTYWVTAMEGHPEHLPTPRDRWRRDRARIARWIDELRVVGPLLRKRAAESGQPCRYELSEGGWLGVVCSSGDLRVYVEPPNACSAGEAWRLAAIAAACVATRPGWRREGEDAGVHCMLLVEGDSVA